MSVETPDIISKDRLMDLGARPVALISHRFLLEIIMNFLMPNRNYLHVTTSQARQGPTCVVDMNPENHNNPFRQPHHSRLMSSTSSSNARPSRISLYPTSTPHHTSTFPHSSTSSTHRTPNTSAPTTSSSASTVTATNSQLSQSQHRTRQYTHLHAQLAQLNAQLADMENLLHMTAVQAECIRGLGGWWGGA